MENLFQASFTDSLKSFRYSKKTEELLRKQAALFRSFDSMLELSNGYSSSNKYDLEEALEILKFRWGLIFKTHIEIDADLGGSNTEYQNKYYEQEAIYRHHRREINLKLHSKSLQKNFLEIHMESPVLRDSHNSKNSLYALEMANNQTGQDLIAKQQRPSSKCSISKKSLYTHFNKRGNVNKI
ncbi:unnamed protein product [Pieris brassicae]|uniref:Uncharacterized protein n=1 Tax=Pieris brassicae TaxID=7116 RepID=A0A9P0TI22_PIEBR|nr:unnamed protein product [Pieris brassicae]